MAFIKAYLNELKVVDGRQLNSYHTDMELKFNVITSRQGCGYEIYVGEKELAKVNFSELVINGHKLKSNSSKTEWILREMLDLKLSIGSENDYCLNGESVCRVSKGGYLVNWLIDMVKQRAFEPYKPYCMVEFDCDKIEPLLALCILFMNIDRSNSNI